jgi:pyruvate/2-oxoglutarate dehydrogenase complex dihydrolipoamide acyltransferase (E2) component
MPETIETASRPTRLQRAMAKTMTRAANTAVLSQVVRDIDMTSVEHDRAGAAERSSINTYVLAAVTGSLVDHPMLNSRLDEGSVVVPDRVNLGIAVSVPDGLVVPVIHGADRLSFPELEATARAAAAKAQSGELTFPDIEGGTFTVSNLGMFGIDGGFAIPPHPQAAILLVGRVRRCFVPDDAGLPVARPVCRCGLSFDHRFIDGASAARFLMAVDAALADAARLRENLGR